MKHSVSWVSVLFLAAPANHSKSSTAIMYNVFDISGAGGGAGREEVFSTSMGYHEYIVGYHKYIGVCSEL